MIVKMHPTVYPMNTQATVVEDENGITIKAAGQNLFRLRPDGTATVYGQYCKHPWEVMYDNNGVFLYMARWSDPEKEETE